MEEFVMHVFCPHTIVAVVLLALTLVGWRRR